MSIDPNLINVSRVGELPPAPFSLTDKLPHEVGTDLTQGTIQQMADVIGAYLGATNAVNFISVNTPDGGTLPSQTQPAWTFVGAGTFNQSSGAAIVTTEPLNVLVHDGTSWSIGVEIPINADPTAIGISQTVNAGVTNFAPSEDAVRAAIDANNPLTSIGSFYYQDVTTATTPINVSGNTPITNDALGAKTDLSNAPFGVPNIWNAQTNTLDLSQLSVGDIVKVKIDGTVITTVADQIFRTRFILGDESAPSNADIIGTKSFPTIGSNYFVTESSFTVQQDHIDSTTNSLIIISPTYAATFIVDYLYFEVIRKNINVVTFAGDGIPLQNRTLLIESEDDDLIPIFDVSDTTESPQGTNKAQRKTDFLGGLDLLGTRANEGNGFGTYFSEYPRENFGNIGLNAFDFSHSKFESTTNGATGELSFAQGEEVEASGYLAKASGYLVKSKGIADNAHGINIETQGYLNDASGIGHDVTGLAITTLGQASEIITQNANTWNETESPVLVVGNGTIQDSDPDFTVLTRSNALVVRKNGKVEAPSLTAELINSGVEKTLVTKEWVNRRLTFYVPENYDFADIGTVTQKNIVIRYEHDLAGGTVNFGSKKNIIFQGGAFINGFINGTNCNVIAEKINLFPSADVVFQGTWTNEFYPEWWATSATTDFRLAIQSAIDAAALNCGKVFLSSFLYTYYNQITLKAGVSFWGVSKGDTAFGAASIKGSVLWCLGNSLGSTANDNVALKVVGRMSSMRDFTLKGERSLTKLGSGMQIYGVGDGISSNPILEHLDVQNVLIHGFQKGKGLHIVAGNSGAVTYSTFYNVRIRDCEEQMTIESLSSNPIYGNLGSTGLPYISPTGFVNSMTFSGLYMSGYCQSGLKVVTQANTALVNSQTVFTPANNLIFSGVVIENPNSTNSHIRLEGGGSSVRMQNVRIEALTQDANYPEVPVVYLGEGVNGCVIDLDQASVPIQDLGFNNRINSKSTKNAIPSIDSYNLYKNSALLGLNKGGGTVFIPEWRIQEQGIGVGDTYAWRDLETTSNVLLDYTSSVYEQGYKTIQVTVPPNYQFRMFQDIDRTLNRIPTGRVNGIVKTANLKDVIWTYQDSVTPIVSGGTTFGGNEFEPIGGFFVITPTTVSTFYRIALFCQNYTASDIVFEFTMPSFVTGEVTPKLPAKPITDIGGTIYGVIGQNVVKNIQPVSNPNHRVGATSNDVLLPLEGNTFEINDTNFFIQKINATSNRFPIGATITLVCLLENVEIVDSAFINLHKPFISLANTSITLQSVDGNGLWREVYRSEPKEIGLDEIDIDDVLVGTEATIDRYLNVFEITNTSGTAKTLSRLNNAVNRFSAGKTVTLKFIDANGLITLTNGLYITLSLAGNYIPLNGDWITLETRGDGTWYEISRKPLALPVVNSGKITLEASAITVTNFLTLPLTGENYFVLDNTSGASLTIQRINDSILKRFQAGKEITIEFGTLTNGITISNSGFITLNITGNFIVETGAWIKLIARQDGTWRETARSTSSKSPAALSLTLSATYLSGNFLTLPTTGENFFNLSAATTGGSILRINNAAANRFGGGKIIMIKFNNITVAPTFVHSGFLILAGAVNYSPALNGGIVLWTEGDGTWRELQRF